MKYLLEKGAKIDVTDKRGLTPIAIAVINDQVEVVRLLLDSGASVTCTDHDGNSLAHLIACDNVEMVEILISHGTAIDQEDSAGFTPIHSAAMNGFAGLTRCFVSKGCSLSKRNKDGKTPLDLIRRSPKLGEHFAVQMVEIAKSVK